MVCGGGTEEVVPRAWGGAQIAALLSDPLARADARHGPRRDVL